MKKIILIWLVLTMSMTGVYAETKEDFLSKVVEVTTSTKTLSAEHMVLSIKTTTYLLKSLDIKVQTIEANVIVTKGTTGYEHVKAIVEKDIEYIYNLVSDVEYLPLQMGSGEYTVSLLGSNDGRRFKMITSKDFTVELEENAVFLSSSQTVNWSDDTDISVLAYALTKDLVSDEEKLNAIHEYIVENVRYDYSKAASLPKGYIPDPLATLNEGSGICYDFAALLASMMRSVDIPAKLVKGYSTYTPVYHAWNEILIEDTWWIVDTSTDSIYVDYDAPYVINKSSDDYTNSKVY